MATGMSWQDGNHRVGVFDVTGAAPVLLEDSWVDDPGEAAMMARYQATGVDVRQGWWDAWLDAGWSLLWTDDRRPFASWTPREPAWRLQGECLVAPDGAAYPLPSLQRVLHAVEAGWTERLVRIEREGDPLVVFLERSETPLVDPSYDGILLDEDTSVMRLFAGALARGTGLPYAQRID